MLHSNSSSSVLLSTSILKKFKEEFEKTGMFQFTPELEGKLTKCLDETFTENQFTYPSSPLTIDVDAARNVSEQLEKATLPPPLVFQFDVERPKNASVSMGMLINGELEVIKNEQGSYSTPALAAFTIDKGFVYGTEASILLFPSKEMDCYLPNLRTVQPPKVWSCNGLQLFSLTTQQHYQHVDLKDFGIFNLPAQFFSAYLIRKLKITAEGTCNNVGLCQLAILTVPMHTKCAQRLRLKEAASLAGFTDVYLISAEGLAAYYWFHEKGKEMEKNNYSKDFVIIDLFGHAVVYQRSFDCETDNGRIVILVKPIILLYLFTAMAKEEDEFGQMIQRKLEIDQMETRIPVLREYGDFASSLYFGSKFADKIGIVDDNNNDELDKFKHFAVKGAALLSKNPENVDRIIMNMVGTTIKIEPDQEIILPETMLPVKLMFYIEHHKAIYVISQKGNGRWQDKEVIGCLSIHGVKHGAELEVSYELSWEGIWKVVGVSAKGPSDEEDDDLDYKPVKWDWFMGDQMDFTNFGGSSYEECKSLLEKVTMSLPSQATVKVESAVLLSEEGSSQNRTDTENNCIVGQGCCSFGTEKRKRAVIKPNDLIVSTGLKKIKLESDWVDKVIVKGEQDLMSQEEVEFGEAVKQVKLEEFLIDSDSD